jgi:transposase-like protein
MSGTKLKKRHRRRYYSENFKREAVATYEASGKSRAEICQLLDISCGSLLQNWSVLYSAQKRHRKSNIAMIKDTKPPSTSETITKPSNSTEAVRICELEAEVKRLKQALGNHAVKDYLAELREESWREISSEAALKEVERRVSKKL